uniref:Uncharacterized protein n=1 Tax=Populus trichocarpa TaxID=3694 RepID=A0A3N7FZ59_POPTR
MMIGFTTSKALTASLIVILIFYTLRWRSVCAFFSKRSCQVLSAKYEPIEAGLDKAQVNLASYWDTCKYLYESVGRISCSYAFVSWCTSFVREQIKHRMKLVLKRDVFSN